MRRKILIIDDDKVLREKLKKALVLEDFYVLEADNGASGLKLAMVENPDLIFMDLILPKISGIKLLKNLRKHINEKNIPTVIHTNLNYATYIGKAVDLGVKAYLIKSLYGIGELSSKIKKYARRQQSA